MAGSLHMNENEITDMLEPSAEQEAVNKRFLEAWLDDYLSQKGGNEIVADLDMAGYKIIQLKNVDACSQPTDAINKQYADTKVDAIPQANFNMNDNEIVNLATPTTFESTTNKQHVGDDRLNVFGTNKMLASLNMDNNNVINIPDRTADDTSAVTKKYVAVEKNSPMHTNHIRIQKNSSRVRLPGTRESHSSK